MRALVLLCLLHGAFVESQLTWEGSAPSGGSASSSEEAEPHVCLVDQASCGCCLMQRKVQRMETFFNMTIEELKEKLTQSKTALNDLRASRSAFSVALNHSENSGCFGPAAAAALVPYRRVFLNLGGGYSAATGVFTAPRSGVYSLAVTAYANISPTGADLLVNGHAVASLREEHGPDREDSATAVVAARLRAGDEVAVGLPVGYLLCDDRSTFTGFLLYPCDV